MKANSIIVKSITLILTGILVTVFLTFINTHEVIIMSFLLLSFSLFIITLMWHFQVSRFVYNVNYDYREPGFQEQDEISTGYTLPSIGQLERKLSIAIENDAIDIYFQKIIDVKTNEVIYIEELARWNEEEFGYIEPDLLFEVAASSNQTIKLDHYLIEKSIKCYTEYCKKTNTLPKLALNLTPDTFLHKGTLNHLNTVIKKYHTTHHNICLEIAETTFINDHEECIKNIDNYKKKGFTIALDDFGKSYSSLSILDSIEYDVIKIDRLFTQNIDSKRTQEIVRMIKNITEMSGKSLVIEGVENETQKMILEQLKCTVFQGFLLHRPEKF